MRSPTGSTRPTTRRPIRRCIWSTSGQDFSRRWRPWGTPSPTVSCRPVEACGNISGASGRREMTPERWVEVERLFHAALERPPLDRAAFLDDSCSGDTSLRDEVQSLLDASSPGEEFLEGPPVGIAAALDVPPQQRLLGRRLSEYEQ